MIKSVPFGIPGDYDGIAELWFDGIESAAAAFGEPKYMEVIRPDELKFVDIAKCISFVPRRIRSSRGALQSVVEPA